MSQVSKYPLAKDIEQKILEIFCQSLADLKNKESVYQFITDFLTPTEKTMLAKRLAIAILLFKDYDHRHISQYLKVSTTTINYVKAKLQYGGEGYKLVISKYLKQQKREEFFDKLDEEISRIVPPPKGSDWRAQRKIEWQKRLEHRRQRRII